MTTLVVLALVGTTSLAAYLRGARRHGRTPAGLGAAAGHVLDGLGWGLLFLGANLGLGLLAIGLVRGLTGRFVSLYVLDDVTLLALSLLQGLLYQAWRGRGRESGPPATPRGR